MTMTRKSKRNMVPKSPDPNRPYPQGVTIQDTGREYRVSVAEGTLKGKAEPFAVLTTEGLRRRILDWLSTLSIVNGWRLGFVYFHTITRRHPRCETCHGYGTIPRDIKSPDDLCSECFGAGFLLPGFGNRN